MNQTLRVGIIGGGWPGEAHAQAYQQAAGCKVVAVADLIPARRESLARQYGAKTFADARELLLHKELDAVSICAPTDQHAAMTLAALRAGRHVLCEMPPAVDVKQARQMAAAARKHGRVLMYAMRRRFGSHEQAARQAIEKGYIGQARHVRASWMRSRGIPVGTGWYTDKARSGGGVMMDLGIHMLDLGWSLLDRPTAATVYGVTHQGFRDLVPADQTYDVEDSAHALIRFDTGASLELAASWAINQPPRQSGATCRVNASGGALEVYTPQGAILYRKFDDKGQAKPTALKGPNIIHHAAMIRQFRQTILGKSEGVCGPEDGIMLLRLIEAIYKSAAAGRSVRVE